MRFGKKLALQVQGDTSGAPYLSHKPMKEAINRTVRELRMLQSLQSGQPVQDQAWRGADANGATVTLESAELAEFEERVSSLDKQLFNLVDEDLARILAYVRDGEARLAGHIAALQGDIVEAGIIFEERQLQHLERVLPNAPSDRTVLARQLLELRLRSDPPGMAGQLEELAAKYNAVADVADGHTQYLEINVAGFRKLLKRHDKQIPHRFRSRPMSCLGFHRLVTHTSRSLLDLTRQLGGVLRHAQQRLADQVASSGAVSEEADATLAGVEFREVKGLGPECEMVLDIQKQLKDPMNMQLAASVGGSTPGFLYPKPGAAGTVAAARPGVAEAAEEQEAVSSRSTLRASAPVYQMPEPLDPCPSPYMITAMPGMHWPAVGGYMGDADSAKVALTAVGVW